MRALAGWISPMVALAVTATAGLAAVTPATPVRLSAKAAAAAIRAIEHDRAETQTWLRSDPTSYLATIDRRDFLGKSTLTVGRARDNDLRIDHPDVQPHHLRVTVEGDRFRVDAVDAAARFTARTSGAEQSLRTATLDPTNITIGRFLVRLSHQRFPALIVFDPQSPRFREYKGLRYYKPDLAYRFVLRLTPNPTPDVVPVMSTRGNQRRAERVGWFDFVIDGAPCRLEALRLLEPGVDESALSVFFRDATAGHGSYELGRYVDATPVGNGSYLLDFNLAYNPACAFSDHYNCPIPPRANVLTVAIRAGEMDSHYHAAPSVP